MGSVIMDDMNRLAAEAAVIDAEQIAASAPPDAAPSEPVAPPADYLTEARGVVGFVCVAACAVFPCLAPIYSQEVQEKLAVVTAPLLEQYKVDLGGIMGKYGNWINFAMIVLPLGAQTFQAMKALADKQPAGKAATAPQVALTEERARAVVAPVPMHLQPANDDAA